MQYLKNIWLLCAFFCVEMCVQAQSQLPSLIDNAQAENNYLQNTVLKPGENPQEKIRNLVFIKTSVSKKNCFVGEPVLVTYQLYASLYCQPKVVKQPSFNNCSLVEMTTDEPAYIERNGKKIYHVFLIRKVQLTPLQEGELAIPPAVVDNEVGFTSTENPYRVQEYSASVNSAPDSIHVKALPAGMPADFSGITGRFTISAKVDSNTLPQGGDAQLQVTIAGEGNIEAIATPVIAWPEGIEHFEGTDSQHINKTSFPVKGDKTFAIPFVGTKKGKAVIPEVKFTYFNTALQQYQTIATRPIAITVTKALPARKDENIVTEDVSNKKYLWFVPAIALIVIVAWVISTRKKELAVLHAPKPVEKVVVEEKPVERPDFKLLLQALSEAEDNQTFFTNAKTILSSALELNGYGNTRDEALRVATLEEKHKDLAKEVKSVYAICNQNLYSPVIDEDARTTLINRLTTIIYMLEKS